MSLREIFSYVAILGWQLERPAGRCIAWASPPRRDQLAALRTPAAMASEEVPLELLPSGREAPLGDAGVGEPVPDLVAV